MKIVGTTEDRLNRFMQMCLEWQRDSRNGIKKKAAYYFTNYHVGKVNKNLIGDLTTQTIDRNWAIDKLNSISLHRAQNEIRLGGKASNRTIYNETNRDYASKYQISYDLQPEMIKKTSEKKELSAFGDVELLTELLTRLKNKHTTSNNN